MYISTGNATRAVLEYIRPFVSGYKIDLKTMAFKIYRRLGAALQKVLDGIPLVHATCPHCGAHLAGLWTDQPESVRRHGPGGPRPALTAPSRCIDRFRSDLTR